MERAVSDLSPFFNPESVAIVGVPTGQARFGGLSFLIRLMDAGFKGTLYPINPKAEEIQGLKCYPDLSSLPEAPDLVMLCVAARHIPGLLEECARIGSRYIHIFSSGFSEVGTDAGQELHEEIIGLSEKHGLNIVGPNCMGLYSPSVGLTAWGAIPGKSGPVGIISQSGGLTQRLTEYLYSFGLGVAKAVSLGNSACLGVTDFLKHMGADENLQVITMYMESSEPGRKLLELAKNVSSKKPIIIWKGGMSDAGARTVASHTGSMAGASRVWEAFLKQSGVIGVDSLNECADMSLGLSLLPKTLGKNVFLIGGGGGSSVSHSDIAAQEGLNVPPLSPEIMSRLKSSVPDVGSIAGNPLDMWQTFEDTPYLIEVMKLGLADPGIDMIVVDRLIPRAAFHTSENTRSIEQIVEWFKKEKPAKPIVFLVDSEGGDPELAGKGADMRGELCGHGIPAYPDMRRAAIVLDKLVEYYRWKKRSNLK